jgi:hypothetical protein
MFLFLTWHEDSFLIGLAGPGEIYGFVLEVVAGVHAKPKVPVELEYSIHLRCWVF